MVQWSHYALFEQVWRQFGVNQDRFEQWLFYKALLHDCQHWFVNDYIVSKICLFALKELKISYLDIQRIYYKRCLTCYVSRTLTSGPSLGTQSLSSRDSLTSVLSTSPDLFTLKGRQVLASLSTL